MEDKILINHQMLSKNRFFPTWKVKYLFLGTFNPLGGDDVEYYYGRKKNKFWTILSTILDEKNLDRNNFENLSPIMENYCFGCIDIIKSIECPSSYKNKICGNGYSDSIVFTAKGFKRNYSFDDIEDFLRANSSVQKIFTTWGVSNYINEWKNKKIELLQICKKHNKELFDLGSPSPRAIRKLNLDGVIKSWGNKIQFNLKGCK